MDASRGLVSPLPPALLRRVPNPSERTFGRSLPPLPARPYRLGYCRRAMARRGASPSRVAAHVSHTGHHALALSRIVVWGMPSVHLANTRPSTENATAPDVQSMA